MANPQNRIEAVRPVVEKLGGKIESAWFSFGDYDIVVISEMPDNVSAAAIAMAFAAGQVCADHSVDFSGRGYAGCKNR